MFPYWVKYTESEYDIQNNELLYKIDHTCQNTFELLEMFENIENVNAFSFLIYCMYKFHHSYFVFVVMLLIV